MAPACTHGATHSSMAPRLGINDNRLRIHVTANIHVHACPGYSSTCRRARQALASQKVGRVKGMNSAERLGPLASSAEGWVRMIQLLAASAVAIRAGFSASAMFVPVQLQHPLVRRTPPTTHHRSCSSRAPRIDRVGSDKTGTFTYGHPAPGARVTPPRSARVRG